jgi:molybdopterin-guanine dinucleotide biosynthesis protein A
MIGIVLCGGQSSRMGSDKGLLPADDSTWAQAAVNKLAALEIPVSLSVNELQYNNYATAFSGTEIITDNDSLVLYGPLLGVLSAHLQHPLQNLFILACDMPLMETSVLIDLYNHYLQTDAYDAFVFTNDEEPEPLCGIYCAKGLAAILEMYKTHALTRHSMKFMLEHLNTCYIAIAEEQKKYFKNFNAHADLNGE